MQEKQSPVESAATALRTAARVGEALRARGLFLAAAESCTGGLVASTVTDVPGASDWFAGGIVAYANQAKTALLGVPAEAISAGGAVSREVVLAMARGARAAFRTGAAVALSGIAGPSGGTPAKPVGTVWIAWSVREAEDAELFRFSGSRGEIKAAAALACLEGFLARLDPSPGVDMQGS